jgi:hypothetical protein
MHAFDSHRIRTGSTAKMLPEDDRGMTVAISDVAYFHFLLNNDPGSCGNGRG